MNCFHTHFGYERVYRSMKEFIETKLWFEHKKASHSEDPDTSVCVLSC